MITVKNLGFTSKITSEPECSTLKVSMMSLSDFNILKPTFAWDKNSPGFVGPIKNIQRKMKLKEKHFGNFILSRA